MDIKQPQTCPLRVVTTDIAPPENRLEQFRRRGVLSDEAVAEGLRYDERLVASSLYSVVNGIDDDWLDGGAA